MQFAKLELIAKSEPSYVRVRNENIIAYRRRLAEEKNRAKIQRLFSQRMDEVLERRMREMPNSAANKHALLGDEIRMRQEMKLGHPVDQRDARTGRTVLLDAVASGHFSIVRMLIYEFQADISVPTTLGRATPLHIAVDKGFRQITSLLVGAGADCDAKDLYDRTPLHMVSQLNILKLLLRHNPDAAVRSKEGLTPLEHYLKYVPKEKHNDELVIMLGAKEDRRMVEITKQAMQRKQALREQAAKNAELVKSGGSTIGSGAVVQKRPASPDLPW